MDTSATRVTTTVSPKKQIHIAAQTATDPDPLLEKTLRKVTWRILPFLFVCYFFAYLDRVNVGFAKLQMLTDLHMSDAVYGLGAGVFFIGYFLFEVPSNLILHRMGARRWIARIMISWGLISAGFYFVSSPTSFYALRFLLGVAEAGFFPGILLYLTYWYPAAKRGKITAMFMVAIPISGVIGAPLSGWILDTFSGVGGVAGWRWLFLIEGLPTVLLGLAVLAILSDNIDQAKWLDQSEKNVLKNALQAEAQQQDTHSFAAALRNGRVWLLALIYFTIQAGVYAISFWLPTLVKGAGFSTGIAIGLATAVPYLAASVAMPFLGKSADRQRERRLHLIFPMLFGAAGLIGAAYFPPGSVAGLFSLVIATTGIFSALPLFWPLPSAFLGGMAAAGGLAMINSIGSLAGFVSPYLIGWIKGETNSTNLALYLLAALAIVGALLVLRIPARTVNR